MITLYRILAILSLVFYTGVAFSQNNLWEPLNGPSGVMNVQDIASNDSGVLFLVMGDVVDKIFCSTDNGDTWNDCNNGLPDNLEFERFIQSPAVGFFILPKNATGVYRYIPASNSWSHIAFNFGYNIDVFDIDPQGRLWVAFDSNEEDVYYSTDIGQTFQQVSFDGSYLGWIERIATYSDAHNLFAMNGKVFHFSIDGTVQEVISGVTNSDILLQYNSFTGEVFFMNAGEFKRSTDGGLTWQDLPPTPMATKHVRKMTFEYNGKIWANTYEGNIFFSEDSGVTWTDFAILSSTGVLFSKIDDAWFNAGCELRRTYDAGISWTDLTESLKAPVVYRIQKDGIGNLYALTCQEEYYERSTDGGDTWSPLVISDSVAVIVKSLAYQPNGVLMAAGGNNKLYRSLDNGNNWEQITNIGTQQGLPYEAFSFFSDFYGAFYLFKYLGGVWKTYDNGNTWQSLNLVGDDFYSIPGFHPNGDVFLADFSHPKVYIAAEDTTIDLSILGQPSFSADRIHCTVNGVVFMSATSPSFGGFSLYRILPNGNYNPMPISFFGGLYYIRSIVSNAEGDVFVAVDDLIYKSQDDGNTWEVIAPPTTDNIISSLYLAPDQHLYVGYYGDVIYRSAQPTAETNFIFGKVWLDTDADCSYDMGEQWMVATAVTANGDGDFTSFSGYNGNFTMTTPTGSYSLNIQPPNALFEPCFSNVPVTIDGPNDSVTVDLPLKAVAECYYLSINMATPALRRCFDAAYTVQYKNEGTALAMGAYVDITLDSFFVYQSSTLPLASLNGSTCRFNLGDLASGQSGIFQIVINVSCDAPLGQTHCMAAHIYPDQLCLPSLQPRAVYQECQENTGSFDPNDKRAFVDGKEEPGHVLPDTEIEYLIRFQNTGTDTAFRVVVEDRLSTLLDLATVQPLVASHPFAMEVLDQRMLRFVFDNIQLPDSNVNAMASSGFIKFRVSQMPNVAPGSVIKNGADIYFDFNTPVQTNTSILTVGTVDTKPEPGNPYFVTAYPNPFTESVTFEITNLPIQGPVTLRLFDALGRQVRQEVFYGAKWVLGREGLPSGLYYYRIESEGRRVGSGKVAAN